MSTNQSEQGHHPDAHPHKNPLQIIEEVRRRRLKMYLVVAFGAVFIIGIARWLLIFFTGIIAVFILLPLMVVVAFAATQFLRCPNCGTPIESTGMFPFRKILESCEKCGVRLID